MALAAKQDRRLEQLCQASQPGIRSSSRHSRARDNQGTPRLTQNASSSRDLRRSRAGLFADIRADRAPVDRLVGIPVRTMPDALATAPAARFPTKADLLVIGDL